MTGSGGHCRHCRNPQPKKAEKHLLAATLNHRTQKRAHFFDLSDAAFFWLAYHSAPKAGPLFVCACLRVRTMRSRYFDSVGSPLVLRLPHGLTANGSCVSENAPGHPAAPRFRVGSCSRLEREPRTHGRLRIGLTRSFSRASQKRPRAPNRCPRTCRWLCRQGTGTWTSTFGTPEMPLRRCRQGSWRGP